MELTKTKTKTKLYILTEAEFREVFELEDGYTIPLATRKQYSMYIKGSYLMYQELYNIGERFDKKPMKIMFDGKPVLIRAYVSDRQSGWQKWVSPLGSRMALECSYIDENRGKGREGSTPFWTYTKFGDKVSLVARMAYNEFENQLMRMRSDYSYKYQIEMQWRMIGRELTRAVDYMNPIWLDGCDFMNKLPVQNTKGLYEYIGDYAIKHTITNRTSVFEGDILTPVMKIVKSFNTKK
jgi:hypothetical protein